MIKPGGKYELKQLKKGVQDCRKGKDKIGEYVQFQITDKNRGKDGFAFGYVFLSIYNSEAFGVGDLVCVDEILYVKSIGNFTVVGITADPFESAIIDEK